MADSAVADSGVDLVAAAGAVVVGAAAGAAAVGAAVDSRAAAGAAVVSTVAAGPHAVGAGAEVVGAGDEVGVGADRVGVGADGALAWVCWRPAATTEAATPMVLMAMVAGGAAATAGVVAAMAIPTAGAINDLKLCLPIAKGALRSAFSFLAIIPPRPRHLGASKWWHNKKTALQFDESRC
jgi:hypothetical protein